MSSQMRLRLVTVPFCWLHWELKSLLFYFPLKLEHLWSGMVANQHIQFMFWSQSGLSGTNTISDETHKKTGKRQLPHAAYFHSYKWSCKDKQNSLPSQVVGIRRKKVTSLFYCGANVNWLCGIGPLESLEQVCDVFRMNRGDLCLFHNIS